MKRVRSRYNADACKSIPAELLNFQSLQLPMG